MPHAVNQRLPSIALLVVLNTVAHFLPPERAALAPDDYVQLEEGRGRSLAESVAAALHDHERPLTGIALALQVHLVGDDPRRGFLAVWATSSLLLVGVWLLYGELLGGRSWALAGASLFALLPQKLETYHTPVFANVNAACTLYVLAWWAFLRAQRSASHRRSWLAVSVLAYGVAICWYEVGFFLPLLFLPAVAGSPRHKLAAVAPFAALAGLYLGWRLVVPWIAGVPIPGRLGLSGRPAFFLFHQYLGFFALQALASGFEGMRRLDGWVLIALLLDAALVAMLPSLLDRCDPSEPRPAACVSGTAGFVVFLLPLFLQPGGVAGRHLVLPSLALVLCLLTALARFRPGRRALMAMLGLLLVVSQGNAWMQVVACRINAAMLTALRSRQAAVQRSTAVVIDRESFRGSIPSCWLCLPGNFSNDYFGAQAFADWGLRAMVRLVSERPTEVVFAVQTPRPTDEDTLEVVAGEATGSRRFSSSVRVLPRRDALVIGYADVYPNGFEDGRARP